MLNININTETTNTAKNIHTETVTVCNIHNDPQDSLNTMLPGLGICRGRGAGQGLAEGPRPPRPPAAARPGPEAPQRRPRAREPALCARGRGGGVEAVVVVVGGGVAKSSFAGQSVEAEERFRG